MTSMNYWSLHYKNHSRYGNEIQKRLIQAPNAEAARKLANEYVGKETGWHYSGPLAGQPIGQIVHLSPYEART